MKWAVGCLVSTCDDHTVSSASDSEASCHSDDWLNEKTVEVGWGSRGDGDIDAYWADFHAGVGSTIGQKSISQNHFSWDQLIESFREKVNAEMRIVLLKNVGVILEYTMLPVAVGYSGSGRQNVAVKNLTGIQLCRRAKPHNFRPFRYKRNCPESAGGRRYSRRPACGDVPPVEDTAYVLLCVWSNIGIGHPGEMRPLVHVARVHRAIHPR